MVIALFLPDPQDLRSDEGTLEVGRHYPLTIDAEALAPGSVITPTAALRWQKHTVGSGESAALVFQRVGLSSRTLYELTTSSEEIEKQLTRLRPGDVLLFGFDQNNELLQIKRPISSYENFVITKSDSGYLSRLDTKEVYYQYNYAEADITSNFWNAGISAGLTPNQIMELAGIYSWDIDFALDIRKGDNFRILYQEKVVEGEVIGRGKIIASIFTNQGDTFKAILDDKTGDYYDENGRAMKKAFLRAPLDFRRVSSNFNPRRLHPVTGRVRPHRGTDYAAPVGTPIWAAGSGVAPGVEGSAAAVASQQPDWAQLVDEQGNTYYYNYQDGSSTWDKPPGFVSPQATTTPKPNPVDIDGLYDNTAYVGRTPTEEDWRVDPEYAQWLQWQQYVRCTEWPLRAHARCVDLVRVVPSLFCCAGMTTSTGTASTPTTMPEQTMRGVVLRTRSQCPPQDRVRLAL